MATSSLMLRTPFFKSRTAVRTIGYPSTIAPIIALALATVVPLSKSQSTRKALMTKTTPTRVWRERTGVCSWSWPQLEQDSSWLCLRFSSDVTCIYLRLGFFGFDLGRLFVEQQPQLFHVPGVAFRNEEFIGDI